MRKIKYILFKLKTINWKNYYKIAKEISKKEHRLFIVIFIDILLCSIKYGTGYMDYFEFEFYLLNKEERKTYITSTINNEIIRKYNDKDDSNIFHDKLIFNNKFKKYINRDYLDIRLVNKKEFDKFIKGKKEIIAKVIDDCGGRGVEVYNIKSKNLYDTLISNKQYLVEDIIKQHKSMNKLYDKSVNSLRIITFIDDTGNTRILNQVLKIGNGGVIDNFSSGGMYTFIDDKGVVLYPAIDEKGNIYKEHPISKTPIVGFKIPNYDKIKKYVTSLSKVVPSVRYVGWDIAITEDGVDVIEGNEYSGVFQVKTSISGKKEGLLPLYRKYMDI